VFRRVKEDRERMRAQWPGIDYLRQQELEENYSELSRAQGSKESKERMK